MSVMPAIVFGLVVMANSLALTAEIAGDWKVIGRIGEFSVDIVCSFNQTGNRLTGTCRGNDIGELELTGESNGAAATWSYVVNFQGRALTVTYVATVDSPDAMKGDITVMGNPAGTFTATKS